MKLLRCYGSFLASLKSVWNNLRVKTTSHRNQSIDLLCKLIYWFLYDASLHWKLLLNILLSYGSKAPQRHPNIWKPLFVLIIPKVKFVGVFLILGCLYYFHTKVCSKITSSRDLRHIGTSKLISEANRWTGSCVMWLLLKS